MSTNYYTGSVNSFAELLAALASGCAEHGWSWDGVILNKAGAFVRLYVSATETTTEGLGLLAEVGTGRSGNTITGSSGCIPRLGRPSTTIDAVTWPASYHLFVFDDPDEVFLVLQFNVNRHFFLAFGASAINNGIWVTGTSRRGVSTSGGFAITATTGGSGSVAASTSGLPFWKSLTQNASAISHWEVIRSQVDTVWAGLASSRAVGCLNGLLAAQPMNQRLPSDWNQAAVLLPINVYQMRASNYWSLVLSMRNARYLRVDYYEPGQIITLGTDQWKVFPGYRKDLSNRDGGSNDHTGTMGWAIRYQPETVS